MDKSDEEIAQHLAEQNLLNNKIHGGAVPQEVSGRLKVEVWKRGRVEKIWRWAKDRPYCAYSQSTLYLWASEVQAAVDAAKMITAPSPQRPRLRNPFKIALAQSHAVRDRDDPTPQGKVATETSSWDDTRLKITGAIDRYSRKRL